MIGNQCGRSSTFYTKRPKGPHKFKEISRMSLFLDPQNHQMSDADSLRELCEVNFSYKPWFNESKCVRIGKASPQLLRITLASESAASEFNTLIVLQHCHVFTSIRIWPQQSKNRRKERRENGTNAISTIYSSLSTSCLICHCCHAAPLSVSVLTLHAMCKCAK